MVDQDNNFYLISLGIVVTCLLDNDRIFNGRSCLLITCGSYRVKYGFLLLLLNEGKVKVGQ